MKLQATPFRNSRWIPGESEFCRPFPFLENCPMEWKNLLRLNLGFNTIQVNVAWGPRPGDEPLNLEDVVGAASGYSS